MRNRVRGVFQRLKSDLKAARERGSFARNAFYTFSDASVNVLAQLILTPLVARVYGPEPYGIYGLFISIATNLSIVVGLSYHNALVLPRDDQKFDQLARATVALIFGMTLLSIPAFFYQDLLFTLVPTWRVLGDWTYAIPFMALALALSQVFHAWVARAKAFSLYIKIGPATSVSLRLINLGVGLATKGATWGLIFGDLLVRWVGLGAYLVGLKTRGLKALKGPYRSADIKEALYEYRSRPKFVFPSVWLALLSTQLPIFGLIALNDPSSAGQFTLGSGLLLMPLRLFGYSFSGVFYQKAAELREGVPGAVAAITARLHTRLVMLGLIPFTFITFFGDVVFALILGQDWKLAGSYTAIMGLFYYFRLLSEPLIALFSVMGQERKMLSFYGVAMFVNLLAVSTGVLYFHSASAVILLFAACNTLLYLDLSARLMRLAGCDAVRPTLRMLGFTTAACLFFALIRYFLLGTFFPALM